MCANNNQSSGKSSVLEAISRVRFPSKSNICTRFATEIVLRRNPGDRIKVSIEPGDSRKDEQEQQKLRAFTSESFSSSGDLPTLIENAKECMGLSSTDPSSMGFSDDILKVEISGPDKPELTLVDLPGLYYSSSNEQNEQGMEIVQRLTEKYMKSSRSIILAVISARADYHIQKVLNVAQPFDPKYERVLGIVTQPDIPEAGSDEQEPYVQFIKNEKVKLQLGWHVLRNRSFETRSISDDARDAQEKEFFENGRWASLPRDQVGIENPRHRLSKILLGHVRRNLPGLIADIEERISRNEQTLAKMGAPRTTLQEQRRFLVDISSRIARITNQALNGSYVDGFFGGFKDHTATTEESPFRRLRAIIRELNECFAEAMSWSVTCPLAKIAEYHKVSYWGCSPRYLQELEMTGCIPKNEFDLSSLRMVQTGGSHLGEDQYYWFYRTFPSSVHLTSVTGATDLATSWIGTDPAGPLYPGEIQLPMLGHDLDIADPATGDSIKTTGRHGEFICRKPSPSKQRSLCPFDLSHDSSPGTNSPTGNVPGFGLGKGLGSLSPSGSSTNSTTMKDVKPYFDAKILPETKVFKKLYHEKELSSSDPTINWYHSICFMWPFVNYSFEELRLGDYARRGYYVPV
ncbi:unnamed protein product [Penicillium discolor]